MSNKYQVCARYPEAIESVQGIGSLVTEGKDGHEPSGGFWGWNRGPLQEQQA